ncbi:DUF1295 domain-containing protein [Aquimarina sp. 2-A2]|uniref:DUF1295 domain-containing protein n=1 Tax=Aquimarina sp. 2-A2 TaxID=3382644 RepID=UPI00387F3433
MKLISSIALYLNLYKASVVPVILCFMFYYQNFSDEAFVYLSLHGTYSFIWFLKYLWFPDVAFKSRISFAKGFSLIFLTSLGYYIAPFLLISKNIHVTGYYLAIVLSVYSIGMFFLYVSDMQKFYTLKYKSGLITEGLFSRTRNPNYFGEILVYFSLAMLSTHWLPFVVLTIFICFIFMKNMKQKDIHLSELSGFKEYKEQTWLVFPKFF